MEFYERKGGNKKVECSAFVVDLILTAGDHDRRVCIFSEMKWVGRKMVLEQLLQAVTILL